METFSVLLALCAGNSAATGEFPSQMAVTRGFDVFFDLRVDKRLSTQSRRWWFETPSHSLWRHCNDIPWQSIHIHVLEATTYRHLMRWKSLQTTMQSCGHPLSLVRWTSTEPKNVSWWRHQMEIFSALLALCSGNSSPVIGEFSPQRPVNVLISTISVAALQHVVTRLLLINVT